MKLNLIEVGVGMVLFLYVAAAMLPSAITTWGCGTYQGPGLASVSTLWGLGPIFFVIAIILLVYTFVNKRK